MLISYVPLAMNGGLLYKNMEKVLYVTLYREFGFLCRNFGSAPWHSPGNQKAEPLGPCLLRCLAVHDG